MTPGQGHCPIVVVQVQDATSEAADADLSPALDWYHHVSGGRWRPSITATLRTSLDGATSAYALAGGMGRWPWNSQALAVRILGSLEASARAALVAADGRLVFLLPGTFRAHTWHIPHGGHRVARNAWVSRYSVLPAQAPLGAVAHELGHLLLDWPDLQWDPSYAEECLMARGAWRKGGCDPAPPCAPLLAHAGWRTMVPVDGNSRVGDLDGDVVGVLGAGGGPVPALQPLSNNSRARNLAAPDQDHALYVERRDDGDFPRLLVYRSVDASGPLRPRLCSRIPLQPDAHGLKLVGLVAPVLRRFGYRLSGGGAVSASRDRK